VYRYTMRCVVEGILEVGDECTVHCALCGGCLGYGVSDECNGILCEEFDIAEGRGMK